MAPRFETIVLGLGAAGSATLYQLAKRGRSVLGIDRFSPPHGEGSSHGDTRITRLAIGEGAQYTPLAIRSHEIWRELECETDRSLLTTNGALVISSAAKTSVTHVATFFANTLAAAKRFEIAHDILDANEIRRRFPLFNVADNEVGYFEPSAGFVRPEECIGAQLDLAKAKGATVHCDETVQAFDASDAGVTVTTDRATYSCAKLIIAAGAWLPELVGRNVARWFEVYRQVLYWFDVEHNAAEYASDWFPVFIWELQGKPQGVYGFPAIDGPRGGLKVSTESFGATTTARTVARNVTPDEIAAVHRDYVAPYLRGVGARCLRTTTCLYTVTPDFGFVIDRHPQSDRVIVASPCSGHGFKHSAAIGEALAQWIVEGRSRIDLDAFALRRFDRPSPTGG